MIQKYVYGKPFTTEAVVEDVASGVGAPAYGSIETKERFCFTYKMAENDIVYGLGEANRGLNKRGYCYTSDCTDDPNHTEDKRSLYGAHNFIVVAGRETFGLFFDYPSAITFDIGYTKADTLQVSCEDADLNLFVIDGDSPYDIVKQFRGIIGRSYIPPRYAFGFGQSRWGYKTKDDFRRVVDGYRENGVPLDMVYMDIDYMQGFKDFTLNEENFLDFPAFVQEMKDRNIRLIPIIDAGVKVEKGYDIYEEGVQNRYFCQREDGSDFVAAVWPGDTHFPDVLNEEARKWFGDKYRILTDQGIEGFWNDMNEPVVFPDRTFPMDTRHEYDGMPCSHEKAHNIYGQCMAEASWLGMKRHAPDRRPFLLSRSGFAGLQRFAATWTGDNRSSWEHLKLANFQCQRLAASGISFAGADAGGFMGHPTPELFCRWMQMASFHGFFRNHSSGEFGGQEPWVFGQEVTSYVKAAIEGRYRLLPYIYTQFHRYAETGMPVLRSLALQCFTNKDTYWRGAEYFFGDHLYVIPIHEPQEGGRFLYIPEGVWYSYHTDSLMEDTGKDVWVKSPLSFLPVYVRGGAVIPHWPVQQYVGELLRPPLTLDVWWAPEGEVASHLYEDAGDGYAYRNGECAVHGFLYRGGSNSLELDWNCEGDPCAFHESAEVVLHGLPAGISVSACMDGVPCCGVMREGRVWKIPVKDKFDTLSVCWPEE